MSVTGSLVEAHRGDLKLPLFMNPNNSAPEVVARAAIVPVAAEPSPRAEQLTQLVLGETASVLEAKGDWLRLVLAFDRHEGWAHRGYLLETGAASVWAARATLWSAGAVVRADGALVKVPLRARLARRGRGVELPDGRTATVIAGRLDPAPAAARTARGVRAERWAAEAFAGAPYLWGGVTPWGVDCSGLVQTTYAARGVHLPRDSSQQIHLGEAVPLDHVHAGDLLFFADAPGGARITHVAFAGHDHTLVHSTIACGGVVVESWAPGSRAASLKDRLVAARRIAE